MILEPSQESPPHIAEQFQLALPSPLDPVVDRNHHRHGMSVLNYLAACAGFKSRNTTSEAAEDGTRLHGVMEQVLRGIIAGQTKSAVQVLALVLEKETVSEEEAHYLRFCCAELDCWLDKIKPGSDLLIEQRVHIRNPDGSELNYGHYDLLLFLSPQVAVLFDWKFGWLPVPPAAANWQGKGYATGVLQKYPALQKVGVVFVQPKLHRTTHAHFSRENLHELWRGIHGIIAQARQPDPPLAPGQYCDYCASASTCSALLNEAGRALSVYEGLPMPATFAGLQITTPEDAARAMYVLDRLKVLLDRADELKDKVKEFARAAGGSLSVPLSETKLITVELRTKNPDRSIRDPGLIAEALKEYLTPYQVLGACKPQITSLETIFANALVERHNEEAARLLREGESEAQRLERSGDLTGAAQTREEAKLVAKATRMTKKHAIEILGDILLAEGLVTRPDGRVEYLKVRVDTLVNTSTPLLENVRKSDSIQGQPCDQH